MVYSMADRLLEQGEKRGIERGRQKGRQEGHQEGHQEGRQEGRQEGTEQTRTAIATAMLNDNQPINTIAKYTGLSEEEIEQLTESVNSST